LVRGIVLNSRDVTDRIRLKEQLEHQATHDPLTDLPNRALLQTLAEQAFARAQRAGSIVAALYVDLDAFKPVNDTLGHAAGDAVLVRVATRLRGTLRVGDLVARVGGDEFVVLLESLTDDEEALQIARRVIDGVSEPLWLDARLIEVGASVGTAIDHGERETVEQLIRDADVALYRAKANGRNRVELFWPPPIPSTAPKPASRAHPPADTG
jgi:diguanylate cyclase (GGDEF)-like protein